MQYVLSSAEKVEKAASRFGDDLPGAAAAIAAALPTALDSSQDGTVRQELSRRIKEVTDTIDLATARLASATGNIDGVDSNAIAASDDPSKFADLASKLGESATTASIATEELKAAAELLNALKTAAADASQRRADTADVQGIRSIVEQLRSIAPTLKAAAAAARSAIGNAAAGSPAEAESLASQAEKATAETTAALEQCRATMDRLRSNIDAVLDRTRELVEPKHATTIGDVATAAATSIATTITDTDGLAKQLAALAGTARDWQQSAPDQPAVDGLLKNLRDAKTKMEGSIALAKSTSGGLAAAADFPPIVNDEQRSTAAAASKAAIASFDGAASAIDGLVASFAGTAGFGFLDFAKLRTGAAKAEQAGAAASAAEAATRDAAAQAEAARRVAVEQAAAAEKAGTRVGAAAGDLVDLAAEANNARLMIAYACKYDKPFDENDKTTLIFCARLIDRDKSLSLENEVKFWSAYSRIARAVSPATIESVRERLAFDRGADLGGRLWNSGNSSRYLLTGVLIFTLLVHCYFSVLETLIQNTNASIVNFTATFDALRTANPQPAEVALRTAEAESQMCHQAQEWAGSLRTLNIWVFYNFNNISWLLMGRGASESEGAVLPEGTRQLCPGVFVRGNPQIYFLSGDDGLLAQAVTARNAISQFLLPLLYGWLGALAFGLRTFVRKMRDGAFSRATEMDQKMRVPLGILAGATAGLLIKPETLNTLQGVTSIGMAFGLGFAVDLFFDLLEGLMSRLRTPAPTPPPPSEASGG